MHIIFGEFASALLKARRMQRERVSVWGKSRGSSGGERAASGDALMTKAISDVSIEIGAFRCGGDQILKNSGWNAEVAVDRASAKL